MLKLCNTCKAEKDIADFAKSSDTIDGLQRRCRLCQKQLGKLHYLKNKNDYKNRAIAQKEKIRTFLIDYREGKPCVDCGICFPTWMTQFDHVRGQKLFSICSDKYSHTLSQIIEEIEKCELVCANCHAHRTYMANKRRGKVKE